MQGHLRSHERVFERRSSWLAALKYLFGFSAIVAMMSAALYIGSGGHLQNYREITAHDKSVAP